MAKTAKKKTSASITWTGKNLTEMRHFHKAVAHYPEDPKAAPFPRDATQHPDNLHVETEDGRTLILGLDDTLVRDDAGQLTVEKGTTAPRTLTPVPPGAGAEQVAGRIVVVHHASGTERAKARSRSK